MNRIIGELNHKRAVFEATAALPPALTLPFRSLSAPPSPFSSILGHPTASWRVLVELAGLRPIFHLIFGPDVFSHGLSGTWADGMRIELLLLVVVASACGDAAQFGSFDEVGSQAVCGALPGSPPRTVPLVSCPHQRKKNKNTCVAIAMAFGGQTTAVVGGAAFKHRCCGAVCTPPARSLRRCTTQHEDNLFPTPKTSF